MINNRYGVAKSLFTLAIHLRRFLSNTRINSKSEFDELLSIMAKNQNNPKAKKSKNSCYVQILGNGTDSTSKSIMLGVHESKLYLFNCGEDVSRMILQMGYDNRINQLHNVFLTRRDWSQCASGLFGTVFALARYSKNEFLRIHSPFNALRILDHSFFLLNMGLMKFNQFKYSKDFSDKVIKAQALKLLADSNSTRPNNKNDLVYSYLISVDRSNMNKLSKTKLLRILILDLPSLAFFNSFNLNLKKLTNEVDAIDLIIHFSPVELMLSSHYAHLINKIISMNTKSGRKSVHILLNEHSSKAVSSNYTYAQQILHNQLDSEMFAKPHQRVKNKEASTKSNRQLVDQLKANIKHDTNNYELIDGYTSMKYQFEGSDTNPNDSDSNNKDRKILDYFDQNDNENEFVRKLRSYLNMGDLRTPTATAKLDQELIHWMKANSLLREADNEKNSKNSIHKNRQIYPEVVFLGTSSTAPTNCRNVR
jgi:hypothetical protein